MKSGALRSAIISFMPSSYKLSPVLLLVLSLLISSCGGAGGPSDPEFARALAYLKKHSSVRAVAGMVAGGESDFKPTDWMSRLLSTQYSATHIPATPMNVIFIPYSFRENRSLKEVYVPESKFILIVPDNERNTITASGVNGWDGEVVFEERWDFPEIDGKTHKKEEMPPDMPGGSRYALKSGFIKYKITMGPSGGALDVEVKGETHTYFDSWGEREAVYVQAASNTAGIIDRINFLRLIVGDDLYGINYQNKTGRKLSRQDIPVYSREAILKEGGVEKGAQNLLGRACKLWEIKGDTVCVWKQVPLMETSQMFGKRIIMEAVEIEENGVMPEHRFQLPEDIRIIEV